MSLILLRFACPQCLAATHSSSPDVGNGLSWPKPQCICNAMVTSQAQHSTNEGVLLSNSAHSMLMSDDLWLPRRGIKPRPSGFWDITTIARPLPLPRRVEYSFGRQLVHPKILRKMWHKKRVKINANYLCAKFNKFKKHLKTIWQHSRLEFSAFSRYHLSAKVNEHRICKCQCCSAHSISVLLIWLVVWKCVEECNSVLRR